MEPVNYPLFFLRAFFFFLLSFLEGQETEMRWGSFLQDVPHSPSLPTR